MSLPQLKEELDRMPLPQAEPELDSYTEEDYYDLPENVRAELMNGQFYYQAAPSRIHQKILNAINNTIYNYIRAKGGSCEVYPAPFAVKLFEDKTTILEPDISVICDPDKLTDRGCSGPPDWVVEIVSPSSVSHDYIRKLQFYAEAGVREYWIVNPMQQKVIVYCLEDEKFDLGFYTFQDKVKSGIFEELWIDFGEFA